MFVLSHRILMWNIKALAPIVQKLLARLMLKKVNQTHRSRLRGQKCWYPRGGLATSNTHVKSFSVQKLISTVKVSDRFTEWQNNEMTDWQTGQKQLCPDLGDIKIMANYVTLLWIYCENNGILPRTTVLYKTLWNNN